MKRRKIARIGFAIVLACSIGSSVRPSHAGPYEIPAAWREDGAASTSVGAGFAFAGIERVAGLGVVAYGDNLSLRIENGDPYVTLGIATGTAEVHYRYGSVTRLADGRRLMVRSRIRKDGFQVIREADLVVFDPDANTIEPFPFPAPSTAATWTTIRFVGDFDGRAFAYAGRGSPVTIPPSFEDIAPALEQRFFRLRAGDWEPLPALDPAALSAADACVVDGKLMVVGSKIERDAAGRITSRSGTSARLDGESWTLARLSLPAGASAWQPEALACGRSSDSMYVLGVAAAVGESASRTFLGGANTLHRFDGATWTPVPLPPIDAAAESHRHATAIGLDASGNPWIATSPSGSTPASLHRYAAGSWGHFPLPPIDDVDSYVVAGVAFDEDGNGWAIANFGSDAVDPESRGALLGLDADTWRQRNWSWNRLRQRGFGLFGPLR